MNLVPKAKYLYVGTEWDDGGNSDWTGLRSDYLEGIVGESGCLPPLKQVTGGKMVWQAHREQEFDVDTEAAMMIEDFELEHLLAQYDNGCAAGGIGWAYK